MLCLEVANLAKVSFQSFELSLFAKIRPHSHKKMRKHSVTRYFMLKKNIFSPAVFQALTEVAMKRDLLPEEAGMGQHPESLVEVNSQSTTVCFSTFHMFAG